MFKIYAVAAEFTANDEATVDALMDTRPVRKAMASNVRGNPDFIVARGNDTPVQDVINMTIRVVDRSYTLANSEVARDNVLGVINTWAQKSRVAGVRGDRFAIVSDMEQVESTSDNGEFDVFEVNVSVGTAVFYNARRVTVNFPANTREFAQDLTNLFEHLTEVGAVDCNTGVVVENEKYGEFHTGNTNTDVEERDVGISDDDICDGLSEISYVLDDIDCSEDRDYIVDQLYTLQARAQELIDQIQDSE